MSAFIITHSGEVMTLTAEEYSVWFRATTSGDLDSCGIEVITPSCARIEPQEVGFIVTLSDSQLNTLADRYFLDHREAHAFAAAALTN